MIKFPTEYEVGDVHGDQVVACECYIVMLEMDDHLQTMSIEEQQTTYSGFEASKDFFTIKAGSFTLIRNFSSSTLAASFQLKSFVKEFWVNVEENQKLNLTFIPF